MVFFLKLSETTFFSEGGEGGVYLLIVFFSRFKGGAFIPGVCFSAPVEVVTQGKHI